MRPNTLVTMLLVGYLSLVLAITASVSGAEARNSALIQTIREGDISKVRQLLLAGADVNAIETEGFNPFLQRSVTPLIVAAREGNPAVIEMLIKAGADVNLQSKLDTRLSESGATPLIAALEEEHEPAVRALLKAGASTKAEVYGNTPLMYAATSHSVALVQLFLDIGANVNAKDHHGNTPLMIAADIGGHVEIVQALLKAGADVNAKNIDGQTALFAAALESSDQASAIVQALLQAGADVNATDKNGWTVLRHIEEDEGDETIRSLLKQAASSSDVSSPGARPTRAAANKCTGAQIEKMIAANFTKEEMMQLCAEAK